MRWLFFFATALLAQNAWASDRRCDARVDLYNPSSGVVSTALIAKSVARTYLAAVYGEATILREEPLVAHLLGGVWVVEGSLKPGADGGVATIRICKSDGRVISMIHEK